MPVSGVLQSLFKYWEQLPRHGNGPLPCRASLNPLELIELLPRVALLKRVDRYNVQACMMNLSDTDVWHRPFVGMNAFDLTAPYHRECRAKFYEAILDHPAAAHMRETVPQRDSGAAMVKSLYLPLCDKLGTPSYIMACTVYDNRQPSKRVSNRLVLDHQDIQDLEFIDIGYGEPEMAFARPEPRSVEDNEQNWWNRFMPKQKTNTSHLDA